MTELETKEQRYVRYREAANRGEDIGLDQDFLQHLLRGDHLDTFLQGFDDKDPE